MLNLCQMWPLEAPGFKLSPVTCPAILWELFRCLPLTPTLRVGEHEKGSSKVAWKGAVNYARAKRANPKSITGENDDTDLIHFTLPSSQQTLSIEEIQDKNVNQWIYQRHSNSSWWHMCIETGRAQSEGNSELPSLEETRNKELWIL